jgi:hypothetical protein
MLMLLGEALPDGPPPGSPLARLLAVSPPARYHLARLVARCGLGGCAFPAAPELARALALAATVAGGSELYLWQADYRDPYRRVQTPTADLGTYVFKGAP